MASRTEHVIRSALFRYGKEDSRGLIPVIIDIDGVLANNRHRLHHIAEVVDGKSVDKEHKDWDAYNSLEHADAPTDFLKQVIAWAKNKVYRIVLITGRHETTFDSTTEWLSVNGLTPDLYELYMRPADDFRKSSLFKRTITTALQQLGYVFAFAVDDERQNALMFSDLGITSLRMMNLVDPAFEHY